SDATAFADMRPARLTTSMRLPGEILMSRLRSCAGDARPPNAITQIVKRILKPASRILRVARRATRLYEPLPDAFLPLLLWTPVVVKTFDEIAHRLAAGKPRLQVEQCDYDTTKGKDEYLHRQP